MDRNKPLRPRGDMPAPTAPPPGQGSQGPPPPIRVAPKRRAVKAACQACRQRKARCDGNRPTCISCAKTGRICEYETDPMESRSAALRRQHGELKERVSNHERLQQLLATLPSDQVGSILQRLQRPEADIQSTVQDFEGGNLLVQLATTNSRLASGPSQSSSADKGNFSASSNPPFNRRLPSRSDHPEYLFETAWHNNRNASSSEFFVQLSGYTLPLSRWTSVPLDNDLLNHLMLIFWTWDNIANRILDRAAFEADLNRLNPVSTQEQPGFCSALLVNAILAYACFYTTNDAAYLVPGDSTTRGKAFANEAERLLLEESRPSVTVAQSLALMSLYAGEFGSVSAFMEYLDRWCSCYHELGISQQVAIEVAAGNKQVGHALSWIDWGFYVFEWKFAVPLRRRKTIKKPTSPKLWEIESSPLTQKETPGYWWFAYPVSLAPQESYRRQIFASELALAEIIEEVLEFLTPEDNAKPPHEDLEMASMLYEKLIRWKFGLPECAQVDKASLPAALLLHVYLDNILVTLLSPFEDSTQLRIGGSDPQTTCLLHTSSMINNIWQFRALYTVQCEFWLTHTLAVCAFKALPTMDSGPIQADIFVKACQALTEQSERFHIARDVLGSVQAVLKQRQVGLPQFAAKYLALEIEDLPTVMQKNVVPFLLEPAHSGPTSTTRPDSYLTIADITNEESGNRID